MIFNFNNSKSLFALYRVCYIQMDTVVVVYWYNNSAGCAAARNKGFPIEFSDGGVTFRRKFIILNLEVVIFFFVSQIIVEYKAILEIYSDGYITTHRC